MSHGPSHGGEKAEPNLVPLLDLVLQLIMFFMMTVNFIDSTQINQSITLPVAQAGVPLDKHVTNVLFLNMDMEGKLLLPDGPSDQDSQIQTYLLREKTNRKNQGLSEDSLLVVLRADKRAPSANVFRVLRLCMDANIKKYQTRAMSQPE